MQLPPVNDNQIFDNMQHKSDLCQLGKAAWDVFKKDVYVLDQPVRQDANSVWGKQIQKLRSADELHGDKTKEAASLAFWNSRCHKRLDSDVWGNALVDNVTCVLAAKRVDVQRFNVAYLNARVDVHKFISTGHGNHKEGMIKLVNTALCVSKDSIVKLTTNLNPEYNLYNGSRGTVVDIVYDPTDAEHGTGYRKDGTQYATIIVDFKEYTGPVLWTGAPRTWVAIQRVGMNCDDKRRCCERVGYPLQVGKADSIHCSQGMTCGEGEQFARVLGLWSGLMEQKIGPGLSYVLASRCKKMENFALSQPFSTSELKQIATGRKFAKIKAHDEALRSLARGQKKSRANAFRQTSVKSTDSRNSTSKIELGSQEDFKLRMHWFYKVCREKCGEANGEVAKNIEIQACLAQWRASCLSTTGFDLDIPYTKRQTRVVRRSTRTKDTKK